MNTLPLRLQHKFLFFFKQQIITVKSNKITVRPPPILEPIIFQVLLLDWFELVSKNNIHTIIQKEIDYIPANVSSACPGLDCTLRSVEP